MGIAYAFTFPAAILASTVVTKERDRLDIGAFRLLAVASFVVAPGTFTVLLIAAVVGALWLSITTIGRAAAFFASACQKGVSVP